MNRESYEKVQSLVPLPRDAFKEALKAGVVGLAYLKVKLDLGTDSVVG